MELWYQLIVYNQIQKQELADLVRKAVELHGHLGPFLVIGVRMGLVGVRELKAKENDNELRVTAMLKYSVPFSCVIDGIQVATKCTFGNQKLKLIDSSGIVAEFKLQKRDKVTVTVNPTTFNRLKNRLLSKNDSREETQKLAHMIVSMPEEELFTIENK
jgi:formylmethanofuran dehydrogenase subunit E